MENLDVLCDFCIICGAPIPEGRMVCPNCEAIYSDESDEE